MNPSESSNFYILMFEFIAPDEATLEDTFRVTVPASNFEEDWEVAMNPNPTEEQVIKNFPVNGSEFSLRPNQALILIGEELAGIVGAGAGEFYDDDFETNEASLKNQFKTDLVDNLD